MRKRDWADDGADEFYNLISELADSDPKSIVDRIAVELRKAFRAGLEQKQFGISEDMSKGGDVSCFILTSRRNQNKHDKLNYIVLQNPLDAVGHKLTWDGMPSVKKKKSNG